MHKKIIVFMTILLFINIMLPTVSDAAVASKAVNQGAKKIAKEIAKDAVVDISFQMVMDYKYVPKDQRKPKAGHEIICLPADKKTDGSCGNPLEIKKMTVADKQAMGDAVERTLDKKIAGGVGATKWGKFLDWIVPIFTVGMGVAVIDAALTGELQSFFDEIAYDALIEANMIVPIGEEISDDIVESVFDTERTIYEPRWGGRYVLIRKSSDTHTVMFANSAGGDVELKSNAIFQKEWVDIDNRSRLYIKTEMPSESTEAHRVSPMALLSKLPGGKIVRKNSAPPKAPTYSSSGVKPTKPANTTRPIVAPGALPFRDALTKQPVYPYVKPNGDIGFKDSLGNEVEDEAVEVADPVIKQNPDGSQTVEKAPSYENQNPNESGVLPPGPIDPNDTDNDIPPPPPEGQTCDAQLKLPKIGQLFRTMSDSFPFSIPWDLKSAFDAVFSEMGTDLPKLDYEINAFGNNYNLGFEIPSLFISWQPFLHSVVLILFDVGVLLLITRLIKGGG